MGTSHSFMAVAAAGALLLTGCGGDDAEEALEQLADAVEPDEADADEADADETDEEPAAEVIDVEGRAIDETVHYGGLEYTVDELTVVDLDVENSPDGEVDVRVQGVELTFATNVLNPGADTAMPSPQVAMRWDEPDSDNVVEVSGQADFRQVPGDASSSGEVVVRLSPQDLEVYDDDTARLVLGRSGQNPAILPVGTDAELVDRFPVQQEGVVGEVLDVAGVEVTITAAEIRWDNPDGSHVEDGAALFELTYTMDNQSGSQSCSTRGEGAFALTLPSGDGITDLGVSERCVSGGDTETDVKTGFAVDEDYAGQYTLRHERGDGEDEVEFSLEEADGSPASERETR